MSPGEVMDGAEVDLETAEPTRVGAVAPKCVVVLLIPGCSQFGSCLPMYYSSSTTFSPSSSSVHLCNPRCYIGIMFDEQRWAEETSFDPFRVIQFDRLIRRGCSED